MKELQSFLIARGVISGQRRLELAELCEIAGRTMRELNLQADPDNLIEDHSKRCDECLSLFKAG